MTQQSFVHLHLHSEYSILDGMCRLDHLLKQVHTLGMPAVAVTDHGNMFGALDFYRRAKSSGIHPILGCEAYITSGSRFDKGGKKPVGNDSAGGGFGGHYNHLTLLCRNEAGYKNLLQLCTIAFTEGFYYRPRIDKEVLRAHSEGLIGFSGCLAGEVCQNLLRDDIEKAAKTAESYREIFGEENFYMEIMANGLPDQLKANAGVIQIARELGLPLVATNDAHYIKRTDAEAHKAMVCIQTGTQMNDPDGLHFDSNEFFVKSPEEMWSELGDYPEALKNTVEIAYRCQVDLPKGDKLVMPRFAAPAPRTNADYLRDLSYQGAWERYFNHADEEEWEPGKIPSRTLTPTGTPPPYPGDREAIAARLPKVVRERLEFELEILISKGYVEYFLIVWDFIRFARERDIAVGPGRGSAAGSIVAYSLRITDIDPLEHGLIFERFLNPERTSPPDIDTDFSDKRRDEVIRYCAEKYGKDCVSQIATFSRLGAKQVVRDVARVMGMPASEGNRIAKLIPDRLNIKLAEALAESPELAACRRESQDLEKVFEIALSIEGTIRQTSVHAAGIVIGPGALTDFCPLMKTNQGDTCTQFEHKHLEDIGLVKMDFLGLKTLSVIEDTVAAIRTKGIEFSIEAIPLDDPKTYALLQRGKTNGIFQLESAGMKDLIKKLHPENFSDVAPLMALYRPGPLQSGMVEDFINVKHGKKKISYLHPDLESILSETYGTILYQEQVMQIAANIAGYSLGMADNLRRAMGKKKAEEMAKERATFLEGAASRGHNKAMSAELFDKVEYFAGYGFNKSHSAAYGAISYQTAYLKANYPHEFMAAILTNDRNNTAKVVKYVNDCSEMGIRVLPPDLNRSMENFTVIGEEIRFGLAAIKGVGEAAVRAIIQEREQNGIFKDLADFCQRVDTGIANSKILECLIHCGAMTSFGKKRSQLLAAYPQAIENAATLHRDKAVGQVSLFGDFGVGAAGEIDYPDLPEISDAEILQNEKKLLGFYVSGHPLAQFEREIRLLSTQSASDLLDLDPAELEKTALRMVGIVTGVRKRKTKDGSTMANVTLEDLTGEIEIIIFPSLYGEVGGMLYEGSILVIEGNAKEGRERIEISTSSIKPLKSAWDELVKSVHVSLYSEGLQEEQLENLKRAFQRHRGKANVVLHLKTPVHGEILIRAGENFLVSPSREFIYQVEELLQENSVSFDIAPYRPKEREYGNGERRWPRRAPAERN